MIQSHVYRSCLSCIIVAAACAIIPGCGEVESASAADTSLPDGVTPLPDEDVAFWIDESLAQVEAATRMTDRASERVHLPAPPVPTAAPPATPAPPVANPRDGHVMGLAGVRVPTTPVTGRIGPHAFTLSRVGYFAETGAITLESEDDQTVFIFPFLDEGLAGRSIRIENPSRSTDQPHVHMHFSDADGDRDIAMFTDGYVMHLQFDPEISGRIAGRIYLCTPDENRSWLGGTFEINTSTGTSPTP